MKKIFFFFSTWVIYINIQAQNVGIGTSTPAQKLDVAGNLRVSGAIMPNGVAGSAGQVLTSNGAGNAPIWETRAPTGSSRFLVTMSNNTSSQGRLGFSTTSGATSQQDSVDFLPPRYNIGSDFDFTTTGTTGNHITILNDGFYHLEWVIRFNVTQTTSNLFPNGSVAILYTEAGGPGNNFQILVNDLEVITQNDFISPFGYAKGIHGSMDIDFKAGTTFTLSILFGNLTNYPLSSIGVTAAHLSGYKISD